MEFNINVRIDQEVSVDVDEDDLLFMLRDWKKRDSEGFKEATLHLFTCYEVCRRVHVAESVDKFVDDLSKLLPFDQMQIVRESIEIMFP